MGEKGIYKIAGVVLATAYLFLMWSPLREYEVCILGALWLPTHWVVYKLVK